MKLEFNISDELEPIETASIDELRALQLERMQWSLRHAYDNVPMYREKFDTAGVHPGDLMSLEDLARFPCTTKQDLRDNYPFKTFAVPMEQVVRVHASSGTTGKPTVVGYTQQDIDVWAAAMARSIRAAGGRRADKVHVSYGYGLFTGGLGAHYGAERLGCTVIPFGGGQSERQVQLIQDFEPDILMVTPSYCLALADEFERYGLDPARSSIRLGMFGAEPWTNSMREEIETRFDMDAVDLYGLSEVIGPGVAQECIDTKDGPTIWEDYFYPEIVDVESMTPVDDGVEGELVFTSLVKQAMPIIRYRTRDLTRLLPGSARTMRRMDKITGRSDDMMIIRGVNVFPTQIEEQIFRIEQLSAHYQLEITREKHLDDLGVKVELRSGDIDAATREQLADRLRDHIKSDVGISTHIEVHDPGVIPRSMGKAQRVIDKRNL